MNLQMNESPPTIDAAGETEAFWNTLEQQGVSIVNARGG